MTGTGVQRGGAAGADEIAALPGFGPRTAAAVLAALHGDGAPEQVTETQAGHGVPASS